MRSIPSKKHFLYSVLAVLALVSSIMLYKMHTMPRYNASTMLRYNVSNIPINVLTMPGYNVSKDSNSTDNLTISAVEQLNTQEVPYHRKNIIHKLSNVVLDGKSKHHIHTAYYDSRYFYSRPAVVLLGYVEKRSKVSLYCKFYYVDNTTMCTAQAAGETPMIAPNVRPEFYFCKMKAQDKVPTHVSLSADSNCDTAHWSVPIPVWNREPPVEAPEGIGVCVHGCLRIYNTDRMFQYIVEYLAMVKSLGAKSVTMYHLDMNSVMLEKVLFLYPEFVDIVEWFHFNDSVRSNGQRVLINDCIYRNMHKVKYLVMMDLDEMIFPVSTSNWSDMIRGLEKKGRYASFTFSNNFFAEVNESIAAKNRICPLLKEPRYFHRLQRLPWPEFKQKTKVKMIIEPAVVSATCVHDLCRPILGGYGKTYRVSMMDAIMAHYRVPVPRWYIYGKGVEDRTALKYRDPVEVELREKCSLLMSYNNISSAKPIQ